ncbi:hypothetical protein [Actinophytocola sp.]|uniref:sunset domain-containing protein n=1 Tax=Actinophytocola sp. TaxID=1872138 RepID=UPI003D6A4C29
MPIFGQVWLWSSLAFLLGAILCWALVALPARRRVGELEEELDSRPHRSPTPEHHTSRRRRLLDDGYGEDEHEGRHEGRHEGDRYEDDRRPRVPDLPEGPPEPLTRAYALPTRQPGANVRPSGIVSALDDAPSARPETDPAGTELADGPGATTQYINVGSGSLGDAEAPPEMPRQPEGRGWFDDDEESGSSEPLEAIGRLLARERAEIDGRLVDDEADAEPEPAGGGTIFTQHTHPIPGEVIRRLDEAGQADTPSDEPADALVDDLADGDTHTDTAGRAEQTIAPTPAATPSEAETQIQEAVGVTSEPKPEAEPRGMAPAHGAHDQTEVMPVHTTESPTEVVSASGLRSGADRSRLGTDEPKIMPGVTVRADPSENPLPKRVPGKPRGHTPFGVETSDPPPAAAGESGEGDVTRALFEPVVAAEDSPVVPPPHRVRGEGNGRGPFGPGSAMPLPGGASPSPEFTIKASVSALRYCTPESPQFGRTVAEVWFKTPADAERVGFRPVG